MSAVRPPRTMETGRLLLRAPTEQDVDAIFEYASDPEVTAFMDWRRLSQRAEVLNFLSRTESQWLSGIEFTWAITKKGASQVLGAISVRPRDAEADFGYVLNRRHWSRGRTRSTTCVPSTRPGDDGAILFPTAPARDIVRAARRGEAWQARVCGIVHSGGGNARGRNGEVQAP